MAGAASEIAKKYFDSDKVLGRLLDRLGACSRRMPGPEPRRSRSGRRGRDAHAERDLHVCRGQGESLAICLKEDPAKDLDRRARRDSATDDTDPRRQDIFSACHLHLGGGYGIESTTRADNSSVETEV